MVETATSSAFRLHIDGIVQGVGFRPYIYRLARELSLTGWVMNRSDGVVVHLQGNNGNIDRFIRLIARNAPVASRISGIKVHPVATGNYKSFTIRSSRRIDGGVTEISPDIAVCNECLADIENQEHRIDHPLVSCTNCGPRFSIIECMPYDRPNTSMRKFAMCGTCSREYHDPIDRRFHAQPVSCNECGPAYRMETPGRHSVHVETEMIRETGSMITRLCALLENGGVILLKGTGGYNLVCDATSTGAVARIRRIKGRKRKPFAVMFRDISTTGTHCLISTGEREALQSWRRPVVLLEKRAVATVNGHIPLSPGIESGLGMTGAILPYMPLHHILFRELKIDALVFTSANMTGQPIVADDESAGSFFPAMVDAIVHHDRAIVNPVDDSVCRVAGGGITILRRARGYVPESIELPFEAGGIFATGSDLKNAFAMGQGNRAILGPHCGDLEDYETYRRFVQSIERFRNMFGFTFTRVACDLHPGYHSTRFAHRMGMENGIDILKVQHHHAHIASCMAEHRLEGMVTGVCFDGTGYGEDGMIRGSEFMVCGYGSYERMSHFGYLPLPGGDAAIREPWRIALGCLVRMGHKDTDKWIGRNLDGIPAEKVRGVEKMIAAGINTTESCGAGRLFDVIGALTGLALVSDYDGEAPMLLESICHRNVVDKYVFSADPCQVVEQVMLDLEKGLPPAVISSRFHNGMASFISETALALMPVAGNDRVVLSGGVFQNSFLLNRSINLLQQGGARVFVNRAVPPNDGGLALGQLAVAANTV